MEDFLALDGEGGRGLPLVALLSAKYGITETPHDGGKIIWALCAPQLDEVALS